MLIITTQKYFYCTQFSMRFNISIKPRHISKKPCTVSYDSFFSHGRSSYVVYYFYCCSKLDLLGEIICICFSELLFLCALFINSPISKLSMYAWNWWISSCIWLWKCHFLLENAFRIRYYQKKYIIMKQRVFFLFVKLNHEMYQVFFGFSRFANWFTMPT